MLKYADNEQVTNVIEFPQEGGEITVSKEAAIAHLADKTPTVNVEYSGSRSLNKEMLRDFWVNGFIGDQDYAFWAIWLDGIGLKEEEDFGPEGMTAFIENWAAEDITPTGKTKDKMLKMDTVKAKVGKLISRGFFRAIENLTLKRSA
jgi:hypothetical protein